jgi:endoglucanase
MSFELGYGVNVSHWLSQSERRGAERRDFFNEADVERVAAFGFDHVRIPVDEVQLWDEQGQREGEAFELLEQALDWCERAELRVVVDLHIVRSHYFNAAGEPPLFADPAEQDKFCALWRDLSEALAHWPLDKVAYELLNEPVANDPEDWNRLLARALAEVRAHEPDRVVAIDSNGWASPRTYAELRLPEDERLILSAHFYEPLLFTHYRAHWAVMRDYEGPINYPGEIVPEEDWDALSPEVRSACRNERVFSAANIEQAFAAALALARETGVPLWCSEFGALHHTPEPARERWFRDVLATFDRHRIPWAVWDYKGDFGVFDAEGRPTPVHRMLSEAISSS